MFGPDVRPYIGPIISPRVGSIPYAALLGVSDQELRLTLDTLESAPIFQVLVQNRVIVPLSQRRFLSNGGQLDEDHTASVSQCEEHLPLEFIQSFFSKYKSSFS